MAPNNNSESYISFINIVLLMQTFKTPYQLTAHVENTSNNSTSSAI